MKGGWRWAGALVVAGAVWVAGCGTDGNTMSAGDENNQQQPNDGQNPPPTHPGDRPDAGPGTPDAGPGTPDAGPGTPDAGPGTPDAGPGTPDAGPGTPDAGNPPPPAELPVNTIKLPSTPGWEFYGVEHGGPKFVYGVTADEGGNIWVAGGEEGLFLLKPGEKTFRRFTLADGLHPYGNMRDGVGSPAPGEKYLKAISVAGGPAGTVFVGYAGKPVAPGKDSCEDEFDQARNAGRTPDASVYKSGDADKVTLQADGTLKVVHYDIHTGPREHYPEGREKLCTIHRIAYDARNKKVWFGGNHGFSMGNAEFDGNVPAYCWEPGSYTTRTRRWEYECVGHSYEHVHPAINGAGGILLTDQYAGVAVAENGDVFFGGAIRSTRFLYGTGGDNFWTAMSHTEDRPYRNNRFDIWPDDVDETQMPTREQREDDAISGIAVASDGTIWLSSYTKGLAHVRATSNVLGEGHQVLGYVRQELINYSPKRPDYGFTSSIAVDPLDGSVWAGAHYGGGITRLKDGTALKYGMAVFGDLVHDQSVWDIQVDRTGGKRRMLVAFSGYTKTVKNADGTSTPVSINPGAIGIYTGD
jgi:hypothetical protein